MRGSILKGLYCAVAFFLLLASAPTTAHSETAPSFWEGKTIRLVVAFTPGSSYDLIARASARELPKYLACVNSIFVQNMPGGGGLCLHTIVVDPTDKRRVGVAISTAGFYRTDDGGKSWTPRNEGVRAVFLPNKYPEFGQCVHKVTHHPSRPERLFLQNHWGLYRSDDWGDSWHDIANGVPSDFGFAMEMHPHDPDTVYIVPLQSDEFRIVPEAKLRVYRTKNAGKSWEPLADGLPQSNAYESVLRDGLAADTHDPAGIYFGTRSGKLFGSADAGESWKEIAPALPPICCVKAAVVRAT
jgi:photosystem II stability/assembly factor-like uncharacterized protein